MITPISTVATREDLIAMIHMRDALVSDLKEAHAAAEARAIAAETRLKEAVGPLAELIIAYQDADSPAIQDTLARGRAALAPPVAGQPITS